MPANRSTERHGAATGSVFRACGVDFHCTPRNLETNNSAWCHVMGWPRFSRGNFNASLKSFTVTDSSHPAFRMANNPRTIGRIASKVGSFADRRSRIPEPASNSSRGIGCVTVSPRKPSAALVLCEFLPGSVMVVVEYIPEIQGAERTRSQAPDAGPSTRSDRSRNNPAA